MDKLCNETNITRYSLMIIMYGYVTLFGQKLTENGDNSDFRVSSM